MFRRMTLILLALVVTLTLAACTGNNNNNNTGDEDTTGPVITLASGQSTSFEEGSDEPDWLSLVTVTDDVDGTITVTNDMVDLTNVDMNTVGTFDVTYTISDSSGNETEKAITITITEAQPVGFGDCDVNFPSDEVYADFGDTKVRLATWMENFLNPFFKYAKNTELNEHKRLCQSRAEDEHNTEVEWVPYFNSLTHYDEILQAHNDGQHMADFYNINSHYLGMLAESGAIKPITPYLDMLPEYYFDINVQFGTWKGEVYGVWSDRTNVNMGIYVNLDMIENYSQTNPAQLWQNGEWTWEAFSQMAAEVKANAPQGTEIFGINDYYLTSYFIGSNGGKVIDPSTDEFSLLEPRAVEAMQYVQDITSQGYTYFAEDGLDSSTRTKFASGELLFYFGADWISGDPSLLKPGSIPFKLGMVPFPVGPSVTDVETEYRLPVTVGNLWVIRGDATDEEAANLMQFFSNMSVWMDDDEQDYKYYETMEDHMDDLTSLEAYTGVSRYGYFEKTYLYGIPWEPEGGLGSMFSEIANGASITATIESRLPIFRAEIDEALGNTTTE